MATSIGQFEDLNALRAGFDRELAMLQEPKAASKLRRAFAANPRAIARAANAAAARIR